MEAVDTRAEDRRTLDGVVEALRLALPEDVPVGDVVDQGWGTLLVPLDKDKSVTVRVEREGRVGRGRRSRFSTGTPKVVVRHGGYGSVNRRAYKVDGKHVAKAVKAAIEAVELERAKTRRSAESAAYAERSRERFRAFAAAVRPALAAAGVDMAEDEVRREVRAWPLGGAPYGEPNALLRGERGDIVEYKLDPDDAGLAWASAVHAAVRAAREAVPAPEEG